MLILEFPELWLLNRSREIAITSRLYNGSVYLLTICTQRRDLPQTRPTLISVYESIRIYPTYLPKVNCYNVEIPQLCTSTDISNELIRAFTRKGNHADSVLL